MLWPLCIKKWEGCKKLGVCNTPNPINLSTLSTQEVISKQTYRIFYLLCPLLSAHNKQFLLLERKEPFDSYLSCGHCLFGEWKKIMWSINPQLILFWGPKRSVTICLKASLWERHQAALYSSSLSGLSPADGRNLIPTIQFGSYKSKIPAVQLCLCM